MRQNQGFGILFRSTSRGFGRTRPKFRIDFRSAPLPLMFRNVGAVAPVAGRKGRRPAPYRGQKKHSGQTAGRCGHRPLQTEMQNFMRWSRRGTWAPPCNFLSAAPCRAGPVCPAKTQEARTGNLAYLRRGRCPHRPEQKNNATRHFVPPAAQKQRRFYISCPLQSTTKRVVRTPTTSTVRGALRDS